MNKMSRLEPRDTSRENMKRELCIKLTDLKYDPSIIFVDGIYIFNDDRKKKIVCYVCLKTFPTYLALKQHKKSHDNTDAEEDVLERKEQNSHKTKEMPTFKKTNIDAFKTNSTLKNQERDLPVPTKSNNHDTLPKSERIKTSFRCDTCDVFFLDAADAKIHQGTKNCKFACRLCNRKFKTLYAFVVHLMQHKLNTSKVSEGIYKCSYCPRSFDDCFQLKRHNVYVHNINESLQQKVLPLNQPQLNNDKPVVVHKVVEDTNSTKINSIDKHVELTCELCYDIFNSKDELNSHIEFHKQLEENSEPVSLDDYNDIEVIEDRNDAKDIITIKKSTKLPLKSKTNTNAVHDNAEKNTSLVVKNLSAKIKDLINPNLAQKPVLKAILLANPIETTRHRMGKGKKKKTVSQKQGDHTYSRTVPSPDPQSLLKNPLQFGNVSTTTPTTTQYITVNNTTPSAIDSSTEILSLTSPSIIKPGESMATMLPNQKPGVSHEDENVEERGKSSTPILLGGHVIDEMVNEEPVVSIEIMDDEDDLGMSSLDTICLDEYSSEEGADKSSSDLSQLLNSL